MPHAGLEQLHPWLPHAPKCFLAVFRLLLTPITVSFQPSFVCFVVGWGISHNVAQAGLQVVGFPAVASRGWSQQASEVCCPASLANRWATSSVRPCFLKLRWLVTEKELLYSAFTCTKVCTHTYHMHIRQRLSQETLRFFITRGKVRINP